MCVGRKTTKEQKNEYVMQKTLFLTLESGLRVSSMVEQCFLGSRFFPLSLQPTRGCGSSC